MWPPDLPDINSIKHVWNVLDNQAVLHSLQDVKSLLLLTSWCRHSGTSYYQGMDFSGVRPWLVRAVLAATQYLAGGHNVIPDWCTCSSLYLHLYLFSTLSQTFTYIMWTLASRWPKEIFVASPENDVCWLWCCFYMFAVQSTVRGPCSHWYLWALSVF